MLSSFSHQLRKSALWRYRVKFRSDIRKRFEQGSPVQGVHFEMLHFLPYGPMRSSTSWTLEGRSFDVRFPHFMAQNHVKRLEIDDGGGLISCRNINTFESSRFIYIYIYAHTYVFFLLILVNFFFQSHQTIERLWSTRVVHQHEGVGNARVLLGYLTERQHQRWVRIRIQPDLRQLRQVQAGGVVEPNLFAYPFVGLDRSLVYVLDGRPQFLRPRHPNTTIIV